MEEIPVAVKRTFERLKATYPFYIILLSRNGHYYVYRHRGIYQKDTRKIKTARTYLGKITSIGEFLMRTAPIKLDEIERAKEIILTHGGKVIMPGISASKTIIEPEGLEDATEIKILEALSTDARQGISRMSKTVESAPNTLKNKIKKLERKYGIKYTIEYGFLDRFNLYRFLAIAKFTDKMPDAEKVKKLIIAEPRIQLALWGRGEFNLFLFILAATPTEAENLVYRLRSQPALSGYPSEWYSSYFTHGYGYIPLRNEFFDLIKSKVWQRTKETPRKQQGQIFKREYATMRELNNDGKIKFKDIDKKYGLSTGSASNMYRELLKNENIWRTTITMEKPPVKDIAAIIMEQINIEEFNSNKIEYLRHRLVDTGFPLNRYLYTGDIGAPYGILLIAPLYKEGDLEKLEAEISSVTKGIKLKTSLISSILVGNLGFRKIDNTKTHWYKYNEDLLLKKHTVN